MAPTEYLINYGSSGFLGRFRNLTEAELVRGQHVVVQSARGTEAGTVLGEAAPAFARLVGPEMCGDLVRPMTGDDRRQQAELQALAEGVLSDAQAIAESLGLALVIIDLEIMLDGEHALLHPLFLGECDPGELCEVLSRRHGLQCLLQNLPSAAPEPHSEGCGKSGCGSSGSGCSSGGCSSGGSGCSSGSCSRGSAKNAGELTEYFANLRKQIETQFGRLPLHG